MGGAALTYKRSNANFMQSFIITQNGTPFDVTAVTGVLAIKWWWKENAPNAVKKSIAYFSYQIPAGGTVNNQVNFVVPTAFLTVATDYNCDIEIYNDGTLILHTNPSFLVSVKEVAGTHID